MSLTYTPAGQMGSALPDFSLPSVDGKIFSRQDFAPAQILVFLFICNHCPYVQAIEDRIIRLAREFIPQGVAFVGICSNDAQEYPEDSPAELLRRWRDKDYGFPYLIDESQQVAKAFGAVCTPDIFVFDQTRRLSYRGRLDDSWKNEKLVKRHELQEALQALLAGNSINSQQNPSMGCSIKWKKDDSK